ncbi:hypothetical protein MW887_006714 [Aspergillus wentii]|nr:hypothetical protein MW887_006714 [Aspergillus wentii]
MAYLSRRRFSTDNDAPRSTQRYPNPIGDFASFMMFFNEIFLNDEYMIDFGMTNDVQTSNVIGEGNQFEVKRLALQGSMSVRTSLDPHSRLSKGDNVVIKRPRLDVDESGHLIEPEIITNIVQELRVVSHHRLRKHPNILDVYGFAWEDEYVSPRIKVWPIIMVEYAAGGTLDDYFSASSGSLTLDQKLGLAGDVAQGIDALHRCRILHSDIKPPNVLVCVDKGGGVIAKLSDFALSIFLDERQPNEAWKRGTEMWMAPEWGSVIPNDELLKADYYSCGLLLWSILVDGEELWDNDTFGNTPEHCYSSFMRAKDRGDELLVIVIAIIEGRGIPNDEIEEIADLLGSLLRQDPCQRTLDLLLRAHGVIQREPAVYMDNPSLLISETEGGVSNRSHGLIPKLRNFSEISRRYAPMQVQQQLLDSLQEVARSPDQSAEKKADASYAVAILYLLRFGTVRQSESPPTGYTGYEIDYNQVLKWLREAADFGSTIAQSLYFQFFEASGLSPENDPVSNEKRAEWLWNGTIAGSHLASAIFHHCNPERWEEADRLFRTSLCGVGKALFEEDLTSSLNEEKLRYLTNRTGGSDLNARGDTVLHWAAMTGAETELRIILDGSAELDINQTNYETETPLFQAARSGHINIVQLLLSLGANPSICSGNGENVLHWLSSFDVDEMNLLLVAASFIEGGSSLEQMCSQNSIFSLDSCVTLSSGSPLRRAVARNHTSAVRVLLQLGASPYNGGNNSPIALASSAHNIEILDLFLPPNYSIKHPPWKEMSRWKNWQFLMEILSGLSAKSFQLGAPAAFQSMQDQGDEQSLLGYALDPLPLNERIALHGSRFKEQMQATIRRLREVGEEDYSKVTPNGNSAMMQAVTSRDINIVSFLLDSDFPEMAPLLVRVCPSASGSNTPLGLAILMNDKPIFDKLLEFIGPNTPLNLSASMEMFVPDIIKSILPKESMAAPDGSIWTVASFPPSSEFVNLVHLCVASTPDPSFVRSILQSTADPHKLVNEHGFFDELPFTMALVRHAFEVAETLLNYGARPDEEAHQPTAGINGLTPLGALIGFNNHGTTRAIDWLLAHGGGFIVNQQLGLTAHHMAVRAGGFYETEGRASQMLPIELYKFDPANLNIILHYFNQPEQINYRDHYVGFTALHYGVLRLNPEAIGLLLNAGADPDIEGENGIPTARQIAMSLSRESIPERSEGVHAERGVIILNESSVSAL